MPDLATKTLTEMVSDQALVAQASAPQRALDFSVGSVLRATAEGFGALAMWLQGMILRLLITTRAVTSASTDLDTWMADYGLKRAPAAAARGVLTLSRFTPGLSALVPIGAVVKTQDGAWSYAVVGSASVAVDAVQLGYAVAAGATSITVPVVAQTPGAGGNAGANTVTLLSTAVPGIDTVTNLLAITGGAEAEADVALRSRFRAYIASLSRAVRPAIDYAVGQVQAGLTWGVLENQRPDGTVAPAFFTLVVDDGTGTPNADLLLRVAASVEQYRALGVAYAVVAPVRLVANVTMTLTTPPGVDHAAVVGKVALALIAYINSLPLGSGLSYTRLSQVAYGASMLLDNITSVRLNGTAADIPAAARQAVRSGTVAVS